MKPVRFFSYVGFCFSLVACTVDGGAHEDDGPSSDVGEPSGVNARFFLPTGEPDNTSAPTVEVDAQGGIHALYPAYAIGGAYYAYCPADCRDAEDVQVVRFDTDGTVTSAMLALDAKGRPRVLLSAYSHVYYATCDERCGDERGWQIATLLDHHAKKDVTGNSFALDPQGRPRFLLHTYVAFLGIGQEAPKTEWMACDDDCLKPSSWTATTLATQIFHRSTLRFDANGGAHLGLIARVEDEQGAPVDVGAYQYCASDCADGDRWSSITFGEAYASEYEAVSMKPGIAMALTRDGAPRVLFMQRGEGDTKQLTYYECDGDCSDGAGWRGNILADHAELDEGIDLALDANDRPRGVFTLSYNVGLITCDANCAETTWTVEKIEGGDEMPPDRVFPYADCNVGAWFLHSPSIAVTPAGELRVGYQARDISGGGTNKCVAGTDMTFARMALVPR